MLRLAPVLAVGLLVVMPLGAAEDKIDFGRQIRPLLAEKCFYCHGLDETRRSTDMRLDVREGLYGTTDGGESVIVPGKPDESAIYQRLVADDESERMPPPDSHWEMKPTEIEIIKRWIEQGASWQQHWSMIPPTRAAVPQVTDAAWPRNEIDHFILARLDAQQPPLTPSPEADKVTLLRRVTYDLTGLPPTPAEVDQFLADESATAYENAVERLLRSPHHGEHMARYWLDAARYGDTHGLHLDNIRVMWPYRDWVIRAFNDNMPFDQFTIEQLAGDLLPNPTLSQQVATGFNRCNVTTSEGGVIPEEYYVHYTNDRVATMSTVWMGISMGCVTCHDHKFDPYTMKDFYSLFAFFNSLDGPVMDGNQQDTAPVVRVASESQQAELSRLATQIAQLQSFMTKPLPEVDSQQQEWERQLVEALQQDANWTPVELKQYSSQNGATLSPLDDGSILVSGENAAQEVYEVTTWIPTGPVTAIQLEGLVHESLTDGGAGRSSNSNVVLTEFEAEMAPASNGELQWQAVAFDLAWADHEQADGDYKIGNAIDGKPDTGWAIAGHQQKGDRRAIFRAAKPLNHDNGFWLKLRLRHESIYAQHQFGRFRLSVSSSPRITELGTDSVPADIIELVKCDAADRTDDQRATIRDFYRQNIATEETIVRARDELASLDKERNAIQSSLPTTFVWKELAEPKPAYVLARGAYDKPTDPVTRRTPASLPPMHVPMGETPNRLHLAKWLLSAEHPLTARVTVNRFWQQFFGIGLVETVEDFGSQGTPPSHPELLDWLAVDFRESGWDVRRLVRMIVLSSTYRQASQMTPEQIKLDPKNRLLTRGPRLRMDAEVIRDTALAASGLLVQTIGGASVKPYQPPGIWEAVGYTDSNTAKFTRDTGTALYRRSMYTFWKRTAPPPMMVTFDAPSRETCTVRRSRTNTPLAALALMNDEQFVEASRHLGQRVMTECAGTEEQRIDYAFRLVTARHPNEREVKVLLENYRGHLANYQSDVEAAKALLAVGEMPADVSLDASELAAWTMVANLLLNLDEAVTKN
jgi:hypothetical protein